MTITAKYAGTCKTCGGHISVGDKIEWERGSGASHCTCPATPIANTESVIYEYTNGYASSMGTTYNTIDGDELEKQIALAAEHNNVSVEQIRSALNEGKRVLTGEQSPNYYYDHGMAAIRRRPAPRSRPARKRLTCRSCGQSGYSGSYPFSTCASSGLCDDCF